MVVAVLLTTVVDRTKAGLAADGALCVIGTLPTILEYLYRGQRYTYRVLQTIQTKLILLCVWAEPAVLGSTKTALKFKYEI